MATSNPTPKIIPAIHNIQKNLGAIEKLGEAAAQMGGYKFLSVDTVISSIRPHLNEHGVIMTAELVDKQIDYISALPKEDGRPPKANTHVYVTYAFTFHSIEDGSSVTTTVLGEGLDTQDKATRKATTSAQKIALIETFFIETGEGDLHDGSNGAEDEADVPTNRAQRTAQSKTRAKKPAPPVADVDPDLAAKGKEAQDWIKAKLQAGEISREDALSTTKATAEELGKTQSDPAVLIAVKEALSAAAE